MSYNRIVIKVGSHVLTEKEAVAKDRMRDLVDLIASLMKKGQEVILVSSGAVSAGYTVLPLDRWSVGNKQVLAAIGQPLILKMYQEKFARHGILCSQVLLSAADLDSKKRTHLAQLAIDNLLANGVVPIINENDVIATEELVFGDNDQLSASVTENFNAQLLVILSDIDALYDKDPRKFESAKVREKVSLITPEELDAPSTANNEFATGGIVTKLKAAHFLLERDKKMFLATGFGLDDARSFLFDGIQKGGTFFSN
ncbi:glutamate 5-kinase [Sulfurovum sp. bin170]|uniref:glutamate 5-kinase n=1 Tax=Sulfurovum sp. bin170 TaxID=2695268 RepID=UPI0013E04A20|nr:glutamate 5-kinase [Sulfurovum sp. bin170]NEW61469.1 glutamate 5-kinase [Sulfurovum sp. bin170]